MSSDSFLEPFEQILGQGKKSGHCYVFPCPNPSCNGEIWVEAEKPGKQGLYICFHCGLKGSHIGFAREHGLKTHFQSLNLPDIQTGPRIPFKAISYVYTTMFRSLTLSDRTKEYLVKERRVTRPELWGLVDAKDAGRVLLDTFSAEELVEAGLFRIEADELIPAGCIGRKRILIPYKDDAGNVVYLRGYGKGQPRKYLGPIGIPASSFVFGNPPSAVPVLVVTEGEFKAIAACDAGVPAVALPGMHTAHRTLARLCAERGCSRIVLAFDTQRDHAENVDAAADSLADNLAKVGISTVRLRLPLSPGGDKMDIDAYIREYGAKSFRELVSRAARMDVSTALEFYRELKPDESSFSDAFLEDVKEREEGRWLF